MFDKLLTAAPPFAAVALAAAILAGLFTGCAPIKALDEALWGTNEKPAESPPGDAPPIVEILAAALATLGYGGMYAWIRRIRNGNTQATTDITVAIAKINATLDILAKNN